MRRGRAIRALAAALLAAACAKGASEPEGLPRDEREVLEWFAGTGLPSLAGKPWVHATLTTEPAVRRARSLTAMDEPPPGPPRTEVVVGTLVEETRHGIRVLGFDLVQHSARLRDLDARDADFEADARAFLNGSLGSHAIPRLAQALALAQRAAAEGKADLAHDLLATVRRPPGSSACLVAIARKELDAVVFERAFEGLGSLPRPELRDAFRRFAQSFPDSKDAEFARHAAKTLETMVAEDEAHAKATFDPARATVEERVGDLVHRLRDASAAFIAEPGGISIAGLDFWGFLESEPAAQLVSLDLAAVPFLIPEIANPRFTRAAYVSRRFGAAPVYMSVGDVVVRILERIAHRKFALYGDHSLRYGIADSEVQVLAAVTEWWGVARKTEEADLLDDVLRRSDGDVEDAMRRVKAGHPERIAEAAIRFLPQAGKDLKRVALLRSLHGVDDPRVTRLLAGEVEHGPTLRSRMTAARALADRATPGVVDAVRREWTAVVKAPPWEPGRSEPGLGPLFEVLVARGDAEDVDRAASAMPGLPLSAVVILLDPDRRFEAAEPDSPVRRALEGLLAAALEDDTMTYRGAGIWIEPPRQRVCDLAAFHLARLVTPDEPFERRASEEARDHRISELRTAWRSRRGIAPATAPVPPGPRAPLEFDAVRKLVRDAASVAPPGRVRVRVLLRHRPGEDGASLTLETRRLLGALDGESVWGASTWLRGFEDEVDERTPPPEPTEDVWRADLVEEALKAVPRLAASAPWAIEVVLERGPAPRE